MYQKILKNYHQKFPKTKETFSYDIVTQKFTT